MCSSTIRALRPTLSTACARWRVASQRSAGGQSLGTGSSGLHHGTSATKWPSQCRSTGHPRSRSIGRIAGSGQSVRAVGREVGSSGVATTATSPWGVVSFASAGAWHWDHGNDREDQRHKAKDLRGKRVLVARRFSYFGANPEPFPAGFSLRLPERFNRVNFSDKEISALRAFLEGLPRGIRGRPRHWPEDDTSWRSRCG